MVPWTVSVALLSAADATVAAPREPISLVEATRLALEKNPTLLAAALDVQALQSQARIEEGPFNPLARAAVQGGRDNGPVIGDSTILNHIDSVGPTLSISKLWSTGTEAALRFDFAYSSARSPGFLGELFTATNLPNPITRAGLRAQLQVTLTQHLWRGLGSTGNLSALRAAFHRVGVEQARKARLAQVLEANVADAYWALARAEREAAVVAQSTETGKREIEMVRAKIRAGSLPPSDELRVQQTLLARQERQALAQRTELLAEVKLRETIGVAPAQTRWTAADPLPSLDTSALPAFAQLRDEALERRADLVARKLEIEQLETLVAGAQDRAAPALDLVASGAAAGSGPSVADTAVSLVQPSGFVGTVGLVFSYPLGNDTAAGEIERRRANAERARVLLRADRDAAAREVRAALDEVSTSLERATLAQKSSELAQKSVDAEQNKFRLGQGTVLDLLQVQQALIDARLAEASALTDYARARVRLDAASGSLGLDSR